ncbi:TIGR03086 family metal-binding protein [Actinomycetospora chiangmaiensis]|uniref:TIGR03086 family metal-binding protein n=1 Tax=Actinomycetospora chiangmaiensis TaxID=402650 RepID=UPI0003723C8C|nr:TIGR03086 family metal-binding protein [Actinomycetospora chiangmaiensis]
MTDPRPLLYRAAEQVGALLGPDLRLDAPTPCEGWTVGDLLAHLVRVHRRVAHVGRGGHPFDLPHQTPVEDYADAFADGRREIADVWDDDAVLDRQLAVPWGTVPGRAAAWGYVREFTAHGWDLAVALDVVDVLDPELAGAALEVARASLPAQPRGGDIPFGPVVEVGEDAGPYDRLVAWLGRDPSRVRA